MSEEQKLTEQEANELRAKKADKQVKTLQRVIQGQNDLFKKTYDWSDIHPDLSNVSVTIKIPSALEWGTIHALREEMLEGKGRYMPAYIFEVFSTIAILKINGKNLPPLLTDLDNLYNTDLLLVIGRDFREFLGTFQY